MKHIVISTIDNLYKGQVQAYTRTRKGKMERVKSYQSARAKKMAHLLSGKPEEKIKTIGSQKRESLATTDFELVGKKGKEVILRDKETGVHELWSRNDNFAGYTIDVGGKGYEFVSEVKDVSKLESMGVKIASHLLKPPISNMADYKRLMAEGKPGEPFSATTKQMEHEVHRMSTMSDKALMTRANKITDTDKLVRFYAVAEKLNRPELMSHIKDVGMSKLGLSAKDFEPLSNWEKKKSPKRITEVIKPKAQPEKEEDKVTLEVGHQVVGYVSSGKVMSLISKNIEKIGYDKWNDLPLEERRQQEIDWMKDKFKLNLLTPKQLDKIALKLEDENYHGPANYLWRIAGMPYYDYDTKGMMQNEKPLQKGEVKPFSRTRRGRFERVKGHHRDQPFGNKDIVGVIKEGRITDVAFKPSELPKRGEVVPIRGSKLIDDIKAGTSPYQKMSMAENYLIDLGGYGPRGEPYSTKGVQIQKIGGVDIKKIIQSAYPTYKGRKVSIGTNIPSELHSWWDEGNRSYYTFYELATGRMQGTGSNHPMFEAKQPRYLSSLPSGVVIVERNYSGSKQSIHIYANESDLTSTSHPTGALDQAFKNFTSSPQPKSEPKSMAIKPIGTEDRTEGVRRQLVGELNSSVASDDPSQERKRLEAQYGKVWDTSEMTSEFEAIGFMAPFVVVKRRSDGVKGSMMFQHNPRFYFNFTKAPGEPYIPSLSIGAVLEDKAKTLDLSDESISQEKLGEHINNLIERAGKKRLIRPSTPKEHKIKIAEDTLKMPDAMAGVMGGPSKEEARKILKESGPWYGRGMGQPTTPELRERVDKIVNRGIGVLPSPISTKESTGPRSVYQIAQEIAKDWKNVNFGAKPYLDAMHALETIQTPYGADSGSSIIAYFLANAQTWKGETAKRVKKELNVMLKNSYRKSMEDEVLDDLVKAESRVKSHWRSIKGKLVNVREHQRYKLKGMLNHVRYSKEAGESRGVTLRGLQNRFGLSTEMAHRVHRLAEALGSSLFKPFPMK